MIFLFSCIALFGVAVGVFKLVPNSNPNKYLINPIIMTVVWVLLLIIPGSSAAYSIPFFFVASLLWLYNLPQTKKFVCQYFTWVSLVFLILYRIIWLTIMGFQSYEYDWGDTTTQLMEGKLDLVANLWNALYSTTNWLTALFWGTGHQVYFYEITVNLLTLLAIWWALYELNLAKIKFYLLFIFLGFFVTWPEFSFIATFTGKDQLIAVLCFLPIIYLFKIIRTSELEWKDVFILWVLCYFCYISKATGAAICVSIYFLIFTLWKYREEWKAQLITLLGVPFLIVMVGMIFGLVDNPVVRFGQNLPVWSTNALAAVMLDENADFVSTESLEQARKWLAATRDETATKEGYTVTGWFRVQNPLISDDDGKWNVPLDPSISEYLLTEPSEEEQIEKFGFAYTASKQYYDEICAYNYSDCLYGWVQLETGFIIPKDFQRIFFRPNDPSIRPYFLFPYNSTSNPTWGENEKFCDSTYITETLGKETFTKQDFRDCMNRGGVYTEEQMDIFMSDWDPFIRDNFTDSSPLPEITYSVLDVYNNGFIMLDGFWLFWLNLALVIFASIRKAYRRMLPLLVGSLLCWILYLLTSMIAYERYVFWAFYITPFALFAMYSVKYSNLRLKRRK